ncbi:hypothetical protein [Clostridium transplantifaecale]|uniref:hypothetical protein n=1 Tax=Clostridium transplantifaecale TaxID=2479838 RepID=UPI0013DE41AF|nr:hypothetical protein [Clostridium transplantifaecale]
MERNEIYPGSRGIIYDRNDIVGKTGIEQSMEQELHGRNGGEQFDSLTGEYVFGAWGVVLNVGLQRGERAHV